MYPTAPMWKLFYYKTTQLLRLLDDAEYTGQLHHDAVAHEVVLQTQSAQYTAIQLRPNIGYYATFSVQLLLDTLPDDISSVDTDRAAVVVETDEDNGITVFLSKSDVGWADSVSGSVVPIGQAVVSEGNTYQVDVVIDGRRDKVYFYITDVNDLPTQRLIGVGTLLGSSSVDRVRIELLGHTYRMSIKSWYGDGTMHIPAQLPQAQINTRNHIGFGKYVLLDGRESSAPSSHNLDFRWRLVKCPVRSNYHRQGYGTTGDDNLPIPVESTVTLEGNLDLSGAARGDVVSYNNRRSELAQSMFDSDGSLAISGKVVVDPPMFPQNSSVVFDLYLSQVIADTSAELTYAAPDVPGLWQFELVVTDTVTGYSSVAEIVTVDVEPSKLVSALPLDMSSVWNLIGNHWDLVEDKEKIQTVWEAMSLVMSAMLLYLWEVDGSKSLAKIPRRYVRKWWRIPSSIDRALLGIVDDASGGNDVITPIYSDMPLSDPVSTPGGDVEVVVAGDKSTVAVPPNPTLAQLVAAFNAVFPGSASMQSWSGANRLQLKFTAHAHVLQSSVADDLGISDKYTFLELSAQTDNYPSDSSADRRVIATDKMPALSTLAKVVGIVPAEGKKAWLRNVVDYDPTSGKMILDTPIDEAVNGAKLYIAPVIEQQNINLEEILWCPQDSISFSRGALGDIEYWDTVGSDQTRVMVLPRDVADYGGTRVLASLVKRDLIPVFDEVVSIPSLRDEVEEAATLYREGRHFVISSNGGKTIIECLQDRLDPAEGWWAEFVYVSADATIFDNFGSLVEFEPEDAGQLQDYLQSVSGLFYLAFRAPAIKWLELGIHIVASLPFVEESGVIVDIDPLWSQKYGRILVAGDESGDLASYYYPTATGIATGPDGTQYDVGSRVEKWAPLAAGIEIVDTPGWGDLYGLGWVEQVHRYLVRLDAAVFPPGLTGKMLAYLRRVSPVWVLPMLASIYRLEDGIDLQSDVNIDLVMSPLDTLGQAYPSGLDPAVGETNMHDAFVEADSSIWADHIQGVPTGIVAENPRLAYYSRVVDDYDLTKKKRLWLEYSSTRYNTGPHAEDDVAFFLKGMKPTGVPYGWQQNERGSVKGVYATNAGTPAWDTSTAKFVGQDGSYYLDSGDSIAAVMSSDKYYATFAEMWFKIASPMGNSQSQSLLDISGPDGDVALSIEKDGSGNLSAVFDYSGNDPSVHQTKAWSTAETGWHHVVLVADQKKKQYAAFIDGTEQFFYQESTPQAGMDNISFGIGKSWGINISQPILRFPDALTRGTVAVTGWLHPVVYVAEPAPQPVTLAQLIEEVYPDVAAEVISTADGDILYMLVKARQVTSGGDLCPVLRFGQGTRTQTPMDVDQDHYNLPTDVSVTLTENYSSSSPKADSIYRADSGVYADSAPLTGNQTTSRMLTS